VILNESSLFIGVGEDVGEQMEWGKIEAFMVEAAKEAVSNLQLFDSIRDCF